MFLISLLLRSTPAACRDSRARFKHVAADGLDEVEPDLLPRFRGETSVGEKEVDAGLERAVGMREGVGCKEEGALTVLSLCKEDWK